MAKGWFGWRLVRESGKLKLEHLDDLSLTYHGASKAAAGVTVGEHHAAGAGVGFHFPAEPTTLLVTLLQARGEAGELDPRAGEILAKLPGAYAEVGPYAHEIHLLARSQHAPQQRRSEQVPRVAMRPGLPGHLDLQVQIEVLAGAMPLTGVGLPGHTGTGEDCTEGFGWLLKEYFVPKPRTVERHEYEQIPIAVPQAPYIPPDALIQLAARYPRVGDIWDLKPGAVPAEADYAQRLVDYCVASDWQYQAIADLLGAYRHRHHYRQLGLDYYQKLIMRSLDALFDGRLTALTMGGAGRG
jgi:hypothetical protein